MKNKKSDSTEYSSDKMDAQIRLAKAFEDRDILDFRLALAAHANPMAIDDDQQCSIFERALGTPGAGQFVLQCLIYGYKPNHIVPYKGGYPSGKVTDSPDVNLLNTLLSFPGVVATEYLWIFFISAGPMVMVDSFITDKFECLKFILEHEALINKSDYIEIFLEQLLTERTGLEPYKLELVERCLKVPNVNIDVDVTGNLRRLLEKEFPSLELPPKSKNTKITFYALLKSIKTNDMVRFVEQYNDEKRCTTIDEDSELLVESIKSRAHQAFDVLLEKDVDLNTPIQCINPIHYTIFHYNLYALDKLLKKPNITKRTKECLACYLIYTRRTGDDMSKCFDFLLDSVEVDINATILLNETALHLAVDCHEKENVRKLLKKGASICITNDANVLAIERINPTILEEHLDDCISSNNERCDDKDYEICIDFKNFMRCTRNNEQQLSEALKPITFMKESREYRYLLQHPVITSLLYLKWQKLSLIFYINFILFILFAASIVTFSVLSLCASTNDYEMARVIAQCCSWLGICYLMVREILQFISSPLIYFFAISNYLEILLIGCSIVTCCGDILPISMPWRRNIAVLCILLLSLGLVSLAGSLPFKFISTNILILDAVCKSFAKFLGFYSIFIFTFSLCFYIKSDTNAENETTQEAFQNFSNPWAAILKTIVMFTGEFDTASIQLDSNYMLFLTFVCFMTIVLYNLLNGLAVSDTQAIKDQAELNEIICRINILERYEKTIICRRQEYFHFIRRLLKKFVPTYTTDRLMFILPNDKNHIRISKGTPAVQFQNLENGSDNEEEVKVNLPDREDISKQNRRFDWCYSFLKKINSRIDQQTVAQARKVLNKKSIATVEDRLKGIEVNFNEMRKVMEKNSRSTIEDRLEDIGEKLNEMKTNVEIKFIPTVESRLDSVEDSLNEVKKVMEKISLHAIEDRLEKMEEKLRIMLEKKSTSTVQSRLECMEQNLNKIMTNLENIDHKLRL